MTIPKADVTEGVKLEEHKNTKVQALVVIYVDRPPVRHRVIREIFLVYGTLGFLVLSVLFRPGS